MAMVLCAGRPSFSCFAAQNTMKATVNGVVIAESSACEVMFRPETMRTMCKLCDARVVDSAQCRHVPVCQNMSSRAGGGRQPVLSSGLCQEVGITHEPLTVPPNSFLCRRPRC